MLSTAIDVFGCEGKRVMTQQAYMRRLVKKKKMVNSALRGPIRCFDLPVSGLGFTIMKWAYYKRLVAIIRERKILIFSYHYKLRNLLRAIKKFSTYFFILILIG